MTRGMQNEEGLELLRPIGPGDWNEAAAAHLARRAGFGARPAELSRLVELGPEASVAAFVDFPEVDQDLEAKLAGIGGELGDIVEREGVSSYEVVERTRDWWLFRMVETRWPLQERLTLHWHDHFACEEGKVKRGPLLLQQNRLLRSLAAAPFGELVRGIASDPAMLVYLDNRLNGKANPNENWARELLELFTLGIDRYEQRDVYELARVFTGWSTPDKKSLEFTFVPEEHDEGDKEFLGASIRGRTGKAGFEEGIEAIELILARDECATFLAQRLLSWFAQHDPEPRAVLELAQILRSHGLSVREGLRRLFLSHWFHRPERHFALYKSPVEYVISAARLLGIHNVHLAGTGRRLRAMGMRLFDPPSVAGWPGGPAWVASGTSVHRLNLALELSELPHSPRAVTGSAALDFDALVAGAPDGEATIDRLVTRLLQRDLSAEQRQELSRFIAPDGPLSEAPPRAVLRSLVHLLLATPQFALA